LAPQQTNLNLLELKIRHLANKVQAQEFSKFGQATSKFHHTVDPLLDKLLLFHPPIDQAQCLIQPVTGIKAKISSNNRLSS